MLKAVVNGIFGLVEDIEKAPISTILEVLGSASYFIANNGIAIVIENLISPVTGLLSIFEKKTQNTDGTVTSEGITMADINALLKKLINISLDEIINIAGANGSKLVELLNEVLSKAVLVGDKERTIVSGIAKFYEPEELIGKKVIVVANLSPATLCGVESHGMILSACQGDELKLIEVSPELPAGWKIS